MAAKVMKNQVIPNALFTGKAIEGAKIPQTDIELLKGGMGRLYIAAEDQKALLKTAEKLITNNQLDFKNMSIDAIISAVMIDRYKALQDVVQTQAEKVQQMNDQLRALGMIKSALAVYGTDTSKPDEKIVLSTPGSKFNDIKKIAEDNRLNLDWASFGVYQYEGPEEMTLANSIKVPNPAIALHGNLTLGNLAKLNQTIDTMTTSVTNLQSLEYNKLQDFAQKLTQALDLASNISKRFAEANSNMIANIR